MLGVDSSGAARVRPATASAAADFVSRHALLLIVGAGALVRFATLGLQDFWLDEKVTVDLIQLSPIDLLKGVQAGESNPALYYLMAGGWERIFGADEVGIRSLSALVGTAAIPLVFLSARQLSTRRAGLIAAALTAASPMLVWYSQEARNYSMLVFLSAAAFYCFAKALDDRGQRWTWGWALTASLALCTHYFAITLIVPQLVWLLARRPAPKLDTLLPSAAIAVTGFALLPLLAVQRGRGGWIDDYGLGGRLLQIPEHFVVGFEVPWPALAAIGLAVAAAALAVGAWQADARTRDRLVISASIFAAGVGLILLAAATGDDYIVSRNLIELWVPFTIAIAIALSAVRPRVLGTLTATGLCALGAGLVIWTAATPAAQRPDYSAVADEIGSTSSPRLVVSQTGFSVPLTYYMDNTHTASDDELTTDEVVVVSPRRTSDYSVGPCWWISTCGGVDLEPPPPFAPPAGFEPTGGGSTDLFDFVVYRAASPEPVPRPVEFLTPRVFVQGPSGAQP